jgi:hypothetical protein
VLRPLREKAEHALMPDFSVLYVSYLTLEYIHHFIKVMGEGLIASKSRIDPYEPGIGAAFLIFPQDLLIHQVLHSLPFHLIRMHGLSFVLHGIVLSRCYIYFSDYGLSSSLPIVTVTRAGLFGSDWRPATSPSA